MAQGAAGRFVPLLHAPGNPQLPTLPNPADPKDGLESLWGHGATINAPRFETEYLATAAAGPGIANGFAQTWLNTIWLNPAPLDFGNITADKTLSVTLHNMYRTSVSITAVDVSALSGVTLDSPGLPVDIPPFSSVIFTFTATLLGDVEFDDNAIFTTSEGSLNLRMIGRRVIIVDVFPQNSIAEQLTFLTDNMVSRDGTEQAMSLRLAPRSAVTMELAYTDLLERGRLQNILLGAMHLPIGCQLWWQSRELTSAALITDDVIQVSTDDMEIEVGGTVGFVLRDRTSLEAEVLSFNATSITLTQAIGTALPADTSVMPVKFGFFSPKADIVDSPVTLQKFVLKFDLIDYGYIGAIDGAYFDTHPVDGLPIIKGCLSIDSRDRKGGIVSIEGRTDGQTGAIAQYKSEALSRPNQPVLVHCKSLADQHAWRKFLHFVRGSWGRFYVPTGTNDLLLDSDFTLGGNSFDIPNIGLASLVQNRAPRRDLKITIAGVDYYRRITSVVDNGATEAVTLSSVIPGAGTVPVADMFVSWLTLSRIVADTASFKHRFRGVSELRFQTRGVIDGV